MTIANRWQLRTCTLTVKQSPLLMGIVNVTPDSFSDGGSFLAPSKAIDHALQLDADGADILDVGGESTRPNADVVADAEELKRVIPVIEEIRRQTSTPISIDTSKAIVADAAIAAGAELINDVTGLEGDSRMPSVAVETQAGVCVMHMQGTPRTMQENPIYKVGVVEEIHAYLAARLESLLRLGIEKSRICLDPGIGFGKTHEHNFRLLQNCDQFLDLGCPILVGHSRKGFMAKIIGDKEADRTAVTVGVSLALASQGVQVLRVHDVRPVREALLGFFACVDG